MRTTCRALGGSEFGRLYRAANQFALHCGRKEEGSVHIQCPKVKDGGSRTVNIRIKKEVRVTVERPRADSAASASQRQDGPPGCCGSRSRRIGRAAVSKYYMLHWSEGTTRGARSKVGLEGKVSGRDFERE